MRWVITAILLNLIAFSAPQAADLPPAVEKAAPAPAAILDDSKVPEVIDPKAKIGGKAEYVLTLQNHKFSPQRLEVPAGKPVKIIFKNLDDTADEFHSDSLNREKVVDGKSTGIINLGSLKPGEYPFVAEYHGDPKGGHGVVIAK